MANLVTSWSTGPTRNDFNGLVGVLFTAVSDFTGTELGVWKLSGNSSDHEVYLYEVGTPPTQLRMATINLDSAPNDSFVYGAITPYNLLTGHLYGILSHPVGSQVWLELKTGSFDSTYATSVLGSYADYPSPSILNAIGSANQMYMGVDLVISESGGPSPIPRIAYNRRMQRM